MPWPPPAARPKDALDKAWDEPRQTERRGAGAGWSGSRCRWRQPRQRRGAVARKEGQNHRQRCLLGGNLRRPARLLGRYLRRRLRPLRSSYLSGRIAGAAFCPRRPFGSASIAMATIGTRPSRLRWSSAGSPTICPSAASWLTAPTWRCWSTASSVGKRHFGPGDGFALPWKHQCSRGAGGQRRPGDRPQERQRHHLLVR